MMHFYWHQIPYAPNKIVYNGWFYRKRTFYVPVMVSAELQLFYFFKILKTQTKLFQILQISIKREWYLYSGWKIIFVAQFWPKVLVVIHDVDPNRLSERFFTSQTNKFNFVLWLINMLYRQGSQFCTFYLFCKPIFMLFFTIYVCP